MDIENGWEKPTKYEPSKSLREVEISRGQETILEHYRHRFESLFREKPVIEKEDTEVAAWLVQNQTLIKAKAVVDLYLAHDDEWIQKQGYPLRMLRKTMNAIFVKNRSDGDGPLYMLAFTESGYPVVDRNPQRLQNKIFKPILWESWLKQSTEEKYQVPVAKWFELGNDNAFEWQDVWKKEGWAN